MSLKWYVARTTPLGEYMTRDHLRTLVDRSNKSRKNEEVARIDGEQMAGATGEPGKDRAARPVVGGHPARIGCRGARGWSVGGTDRDRRGLSNGAPADPRLQDRAGDGGWNRPSLYVRHKAFWGLATPPTGKRGLPSRRVAGCWQSSRGHNRRPSSIRMVGAAWTIRGYCTSAAASGGIAGSRAKLNILQTDPGQPIRSGLQQLIYSTVLLSWP